MVEGPDVAAYAAPDPQPQAAQRERVDPPTGEELRERRRRAGVTQHELARRAGYSRGMVAEVERGRRIARAARARLAETLAAMNGRVDAPADDRGERGSGDRGDTQAA